MISSTQLARTKFLKRVAGLLLDHGAVHASGPSSADEVASLVAYLQYLAAQQDVSAIRIFSGHQPCLTDWPVLFRRLTCEEILRVVPRLFSGDIFKFVCTGQTEHRFHFCR